MHPHFGQWYSAVDLASDPPLLERRWKAVTRVAKDATWADVDTLVRLVFGLRPSKNDQTPRIRKLLSKGDDSFEQSGNDREVQILSAASLVALFDAASAVSRGAALAVATTSMFGSRKEDVPIDLVGYAEEAIAKQSEAMRERKAAHTLPDAPKIDFKEAVAKSKEGNWDHVASAFGLAADAITKPLAAFVSGAQATINALHAQVAMQDEELEMLWWLVGDRSWDLGCKFAEVSKQSAPLIFAAELAKLTKHLPGPTAVSALLTRAGLADDEVTVPMVVNAAPAGWLQGLMEGRQPSAALHPIHFAVDKRIETGESQAWIASWAASAQVDGERRISSLDVARQVYRERLLLLLVKE